MLFFVTQVNNTVCQIEDLRNIKKQLSDSDQTSQAYSLTEKAVQFRKSIEQVFRMESLLVASDHVGRGGKLLQLARRYMGVV